MPKTPSLLTVPWTAEQVDALNAYQRSGMFHPYTCPQRGDGRHQDRGEGDVGVLVATIDGWTCRDCEYTQSWAHAASVAFGASPPA